jgi:hypothetical protein
MNKEAFFCSCGANEHFFILSKFDSEEHVYLSVYLSRVGFFRRLIAATKYLFGYRSRYGEFAEICLDSDTRLRIQNFLDIHDVPN